MIEFGEIIVVEFVEWKSKMYSIKKKRVSIAIEFNKFKYGLFGKKSY